VRWPIAIAPTATIAAAIPYSSVVCTGVAVRRATLPSRLQSANSATVVSE
jgi:hypothetical protein